MKTLLALAAAVTLFAATPEETIAPLEEAGYFIEAGSSATEEVVSDAVFEGRADGGRLYLVMLAEEPPGGATTFSDSVLDRLGDGYVVTVAPETVGYAGDGSFWTADEMDEAVNASLGGESDDEVVALFTRSLTGESVGGGDAETPASGGGGIPILWILLIGGAAVVIWIFFSRRSQGKASAQRLDEVREVAKAKLDEVANDILEMEDEVAVSDNNEAQMHFQRASKMYAQAIEDVDSAKSPAEMLDVSEELDLAIWELDCAEAILDGKPKPPKPEPPRPEPVPPPPVPEGHGTPSEDRPPPPPPSDDFDRRPQRQSTGSGDVMEMLLAMMAMGGMRGGGFGGGFGGFRSGPGRSMGGGRRSMGGGGGRIRGGGRRG